MTTIAVVDYGMGNLRSVAKAVEHVAPDFRVVVSSKSRDIAAADRVVFPGQGAARDCMANLQTHELSEAVLTAFNNKPFLGICMGLQVLFDSSDENGGVQCLGCVSGKVSRFKRTAGTENCKIPHMGWNQVSQSDDHPLWNKIEDGARFYFVHSYYPETGSETIAFCRYGVNFSAAASRDNYFGVQFHPEKSAEAGERLLKNFCELEI